MAEHVIVVVLGDDVFGLSRHRTINKLVVIGVGSYQVKLIECIDEQRMWVV